MGRWNQLQMRFGPQSLPDTSANTVPPASAVQAPSTPRPIALAKYYVADSTPLQKLAFVSLVLFLFFLHARVFDFVGIGLHIPLILSVTTALSVLITGRIFKILATKTGLLMVLYTGWLVVATIFSSWRGGSTQVMVDGWFKSVLVFFLVAGLITTFKELGGVLKAIYLGILVLTALAFAVGVYSEARLQLPQGYYTNPNELGSAMTVGLILAWLFIHDPGRTIVFRVLVFCSVPALLLITAKTGSRAALLSLGLVSVIMFFRYSMMGKIQFLLLIFVAALGVTLVVPDMIRSRFMTLFEAAEIKSDAEREMYEAATGSANQRWNLLVRSLSITASHPLFGVGPGMFMLEESEMAGKTGTRASWRGTHNTYTEISSECGVPALLMIAAMFIISWRALRKTERMNKRMNHPLKAQLEINCFAVRMIMLSNMVTLFFAHVAYGHTIPLLLGLTTAAAATAEAELFAFHNSRPKAPATAAEVSNSSADVAPR